MTPAYTPRRAVKRVLQRPIGIYSRSALTRRGRRAVAEADIDLEIRPDGSVRLDLAGLPPEEREALEKLVLEALGGEVQSRECALELSRPADDRPDEA
jgi:hypothetical protein